MHIPQKTAETEEQGTFKQFTALVNCDGGEQGACLQKATAFHAASLLPAETTLDVNSREPIGRRRISV